MYRLNGVVQHYSWGGNTLLPALLNQTESGDKPFAEYWMGAHPSAPSVIRVDEQPVSLQQMIQEHPDELLGGRVLREFAGLPYLLKVLDVKQMLSIQVHPTRSAAALGFEQENILGIALNAPDRNYKDVNHKPEVMVALSEFWLLHGFKSPPLMEAILRAVPEFAELLEEYQKGSYRGLYEYIMYLPQDRVNEMLQPLLNRIIPLYEAGSLHKDQEDFWAARAALTFNQGNDADRGIFSVYILNLVQLKEGEGIFQDAGILHAYLEGWNMELMANSDNVLRGGLTTKHINVAELMKHVRFEAVLPEIIHGKGEQEKVYPTPVNDFQISRIDAEPHSKVPLHTSAPDILFVYKGPVTVSDETASLKLNSGDAALLLPGMTGSIQAESSAKIFRATVPEENS